MLAQGFLRLEGFVCLGTDEIRWPLSNMLLELKAQLKCNHAWTAISAEPHSQQPGRR
jgi:hypothetical protein